MCFTDRAKFSRHLLRELRAHDDDVIAEEKLSECNRELVLQSLRFQCRVCAFASDVDTHLLEHLSGDAHAQASSSLIGPLLCVRCVFKTDSANGMLEHCSSEAHCDVIERSSRPCVIKESRTSVTCSDCSKVFTSVTKLELHKKRVHDQNTDVPNENPNNICECCQKTWPCRSALLAHVKRKNAVRPHYCNVCDVTFVTRNELERHKLSSKHLRRAATKATGANGRYACTHTGCVFRAKTYWSLRMHLSKHRYGKARFECDVCVKRTQHKSTYDSHLETKLHKKLIADQATGSEASVDDDVEGGVQKCAFCSIAFKSRECLFLHQDLHFKMEPIEELLVKAFAERRPSDVSDTDTNYCDFVKNLPQDPDRIIKCPECDCRTTRDQVVKHLLGHLTQTKPQCHICSRTYTTKAILSKHMRIAHGTNVKHFRCEHCDAMFFSRDKQQQHVFRKHPQHVDFSPTFTCEQCGKPFMCRRSLITHQQYVHADVTHHFRCEWEGCTRAYRTKGELKVHMKSHLNTAKTILCDECGFATTQKTTLRSHKRTQHANVVNYSLKCQYCTYVTYSMSTFKNHMRSHNGCTPFRCPHCDFQSTRFAGLLRHVQEKRDHSGLFLFNCQQCDYKSMSGDGFWDHLRIAHARIVRRSEVRAIAGIYLPHEDKTDINEGDRVLPVKEKFSKRHYARFGDVANPDNNS